MGSCTFTSFFNHYNFLISEIEKEMFPSSRVAGLSVLGGLYLDPPSLLHFLHSVYSICLAVYFLFEFMCLCFLSRWTEGTNTTSSSTTATYSATSWLSFSQAERFRHTSPTSHLTSCPRESTQLFLVMMLVLHLWKKKHAVLESALCDVTNKARS